ncbi:MAG: MerR family transcriptional regulator [Gammaproteobacteria bacterium]|nr:MerR family transcriptional regulator [Gammaproteobacteria bacterium]
MAANSPSPDRAEARYRIGAVCRLTGISQHVLRVWEKRYGVVEPMRGPNQRRLYSEADLRRLSLLKALVDSGHAIGSIATLDDPALETRLQHSRGPLKTRQPVELPRLLLVGHSLELLASACADSSSYELVAKHHDLAAVAPGTRADVAVLERANLYPETAAEANRIVTDLNLRLLVLVYDFASRATLERMRGERIVTVRAPLDANSLDAVVATRFAGTQYPSDSGQDSLPLPPARQFSDRQLAHLAAQSSEIACECPQHLARIVGHLAHFEAYSADCESRSPADAALHRELFEITSRARARMEQALQRVIEAEGLSADPDD